MYIKKSVATSFCLFVFKYLKPVLALKIRCAFFLSQSCLFLPFHCRDMGDLINYFVFILISGVNYCRTFCMLQLILEGKTGREL